LFLERGVLNPLVQTASFEGVVYFTCAVRREDDQRRLTRPKRSQFWNRDLEFGEQFQQKPFELLVGAIDLVDEQDGGPRARGIDRLQEWPLDEERVAVELVMRAGAIDRFGRVENAQFEQLTRVVPFVERVSDVEPLVALEANQIGLERRRGS